MLKAVTLHIVLLEIQQPVLYLCPSHTAYMWYALLAPHC